MCGIAGYLTGTPLARNDAAAVIDRMLEGVVHRGPDDSGVWMDPSAGVVLGHRRLAVVDLSPAGHQPMASRSGRFQIVFNGELYNFLALRRELESCGHAFRGSSDTEVLLAAIEQWGLHEAVTRFIGMFAFALWDREMQLLHLVRDRLGEKPLYYGRAGTAFLFGSELSALERHPLWQGAINRNALALFLRFGYVPGPQSIFQGIYKLPPGVILTIPGSNPIATLPTPQPYWSLRQVAETGSRTPLQISDTEAIKQLDGLLRSAVQNQMVADVPLGAFLSGGVDSSTVVAMMQAHSARPIKTFTIGFREGQYDEAQDARKVAQHLGTEHTELYVTPQDAMEVIPLLPRLYAEPFADSSQIPTFLVACLARQHVTVALSGDGGDELFGGYNRHVWGNRIWNRIGWIPTGIRAGGARAMTFLTPGQWDGLFARLGPVLPHSMQHRLPGDKLHKLAAALAAPHPHDLYHSLTSHWNNPDRVVLNARKPSLSVMHPWTSFPHLAQTMMYLDAATYLPDDILVKVDRAAMGVSLETRVPLLDHRVVEFAWQLPMGLKIRNGVGKWLLRQVLYQYVPPALIERPKMGFAIPIADWLRGPLREWAESLLAESRLREEGYFDPAPIRNKWTEHLAGRGNWQAPLWNVLMFQSWWEQRRAMRV